MAKDVEGGILLLDHSMPPLDGTVAASFLHGHDAQVKENQNKKTDSAVHCRFIKCLWLRRSRMLYNLAHVLAFVKYSKMARISVLTSMPPSV